MTAPTPTQIRTLREAAKLSQAEAAALVHGSRRSWQNWEAPIGSDNYRRIDLAAWELFQDKAGRAIEAFARVSTTKSILASVPSEMRLVNLE